MFDDDRYLERPSIMDMIGWVCIFAVFFWVMFHGFAYLCMFVAYVLGRPL